MRLFLSDDRTQHSTERGARAFNFASFHSTMSVGVLMAPNIYDFTVLLREQFDFREKRERKIEENYSLSNIAAKREKRFHM